MIGTKARVLMGHSSGRSVKTSLYLRLFLDPTAEKYRRQYTITKGNVTFVLETVPSRQFIRIYLTNTPRDLCIIVLSFTIVMSLIFFSYDIWTLRQAKKLAQVRISLFCAAFTA